MSLYKNRRFLGNISDNRILPSLNEALRILITFSIVTLAWVFFRAESITQAFDYLGHLSQMSFSVDRLNINRYAFEILPLIAILVGFEWFSRTKEHPMQKKYVWFKTIAVIIMILMLGNFSNMQEFIYFQF